MTQQNLPAMISKAAQALAQATTAAEVLEVTKQAKKAYAAAKLWARLEEAKEAHDEVVAACHKVMADALAIETRAQCRLADEYDAAQKRGEVAKKGGRGSNQYANVPNENISTSTVTDLGLTRKQVHEARIVRDAERKKPGIVQRALDAQLKEGREPTRAIVKRAVGETARPKKNTMKSEQPPSKTQRRHDLEERNASIIALADDGWSTDDIATEFDLVPRLISQILEREKIRRANSPDVVLAMSAKQKLDSAIRAAVRKVEAEFDVRIRNEVRKRLEETILPSYNKSYAEHQDVIKSRKGVMDRASYRKLIFCVHPDRVASMKDETLSKRFRDAYDLLINIEKRLLDEKESPTNFPPMPSSYDELMKARQKVTEERRAKRAASKSNIQRK